MDYGDAHVCVDALFSCPLDSFPLDPFPLDCESFPVPFPAHHQLPSLSADHPIPPDLAAPLSPLHDPWSAHLLAAPPPLAEACASTLARGPDSLTARESAALYDAVASASSSIRDAGRSAQAGGGAAGYDSRRRRQLAQRSRAASLCGDVTPPASPPPDSDAQTRSAAPAPLAAASAAARASPPSPLVSAHAAPPSRAIACRPADLTGRLAAVLKGLAEGARDGERCGAERARRNGRGDGRGGAEAGGEARGEMGAKRGVDGWRGWREAQSSGSEGEGRKRACVGSWDREHGGGAGLRCTSAGAGGPAGLGGQGSHGAAAVAAVEAEAAGMAEQTAALAAAAAQEGAALLAHAQAAAGRGASRQRGREAAEWIAREGQQERRQGEGALSGGQPAATALAPAMLVAAPLSGRLQLSMPPEVAARMGGEWGEAEAVRVRNLVMALGEAHATHDTLRLRCFTRRLQQQASPQGSPSQCAASLFLAALHARSHGSAAVDWQEPVQVDGQALERAPPQCGSVEWALYSFLHAAAATELSLALRRAWGDAEAQGGMGATGKRVGGGEVVGLRGEGGDMGCEGGMAQRCGVVDDHGGVEAPSALPAGSSTRSGTRRVHVIVFGCPDVPQWVSLLQRIAMDHAPPPLPHAPHPPAPSPCARSTSPPAVPPVHVRVTCIDLAVVRMVGMAAGQLQQVGRVLAGIADMLGLALSFRAIEVPAHDFCPHMLHASPRTRAQGGGGDVGRGEEGCGEGGESDDGLGGDEEEEEVLVCCCWSMLAFPDATVLRSNPRDGLIKWLHGLRPRVVVLSEVDARLNTPFFLARFREALRFFLAFLDALHHTVPRASPLRALLQGMLLRKLVNCVGCEGAQRVVRPESMEQWQERMERLGFRRVALSADTMDNMRALTEHKDRRFGVQDAQGAARLTWKGSPIMAVGAWTAR
ncbi:hypothetical protein CLOM_g11376 [Closterium sp. NIES-68]|nr:hypothetical protein CLOM_g11376 [Closterium sp. NIES-68]GJP58260.1 hypothetical protein CLOP_g22941 [Closterium sp. NIES-67]